MVRPLPGGRTTSTLSCIGGERPGYPSGGYLGPQVIDLSPEVALLALPPERDPGRRSRDQAGEPRYRRRR
ncbi:hypothetical protein [Streptomyces sp. SID3212]|uniref:hypothetical protein n=1 Tax=Streptomyces sp. SID3212 TaxID=2690259 RepID=UPI00136E531B|nr:hypothetical protein [Streptomyces sp. SID3212]MYV56488.1 hypothetical protein [Streptomyces sp. SID3212]